MIPTIGKVFVKLNNSKLLLQKMKYARFALKEVYVINLIILLQQWKRILDIGDLQVLL